MKVLLLCHIEEMFAEWFPTGYRYQVCKELITGGYDRVYALVSGVDDDEPIEEIVEHGYEEIPWSWGYEADPSYYDDGEGDWIVTEDAGHDATWVPPELREDECKTWDIYIGGGYDSECLQDLRAVLDYMGLGYTELPEIIY